MTHAEAIHILELLMEGIHPATGEILTEDIFSEPDVIFSIRIAIRALRSQEREQKHRKPGSGKRRGYIYGC